MLRSLAGLSLIVLGLGLTACEGAASSSDDEATEADTSELRALMPEEVLGEVRYGDTKTVSYTSEPRYRAFWFQGTKGDWLDVKVIGSNGHASVAAFVTDDQYRAVRRGTKAVLPKTGKYFIAVRDLDLQPATLTVEFVKHTPAH